MNILRVFLILLSFGFIFNISAQSPATEPNDSLVAERPLQSYYMEISITKTGMNKALQINIDMGKLLPSLLGIRQADLQQIEKGWNFTSAIDALNFFAMKGWELVDSYTQSAASTTITRMVLKITTDNPKEVAQTLMTR